MDEHEVPVKDDHGVPEMDEHGGPQMDKYGVLSNAVLHQQYRILRPPMDQPSLLCPNGRHQVKALQSITRDNKAAVHTTRLAALVINIIKSPDNYK